MGYFFRIENKYTGRTALVEQGTRPDNGDSLYYEIQRLVGDEPCPQSGIPFPLEVQGWGELACLGETFDAESFSVVCIDEDTYGKEGVNRL